jgi:DNA-binding protein
MKSSDTYGRYVGRGLTLFFGEDKQFVTIKAAERLIEKALWVAEVLRRKVPELHQIITITEKKIVDVFMPREEGLLKVEKERFLTVIEVTLTRKPTEEQLKAVGYQAPLKNTEG